MQKTKIEWCDYSVNPLKYEVAGQPKPINLCVPVSTGCKNCYAAGIVNRFNGIKYGNEAMKGAKPVLIEKEIQAMLNFQPKPPYKNGRDRAAVFPCDMTDLFGPWVPDELKDRLFAVFAIRHDVDWMVLTKHPERMAEYCCRFSNNSTHFSFLGCWCSEMANVVCDMGWREYDDKCGPDNDPTDNVYDELCLSFSTDGSLPNVWLGTSCEDQQRADERIPHLLRCPAAVRFVSAEPLLEWLYLEDWLDIGGIGWVVVGGESGPGARLCDIEWIRSLVMQCKAAGVECFMKQGGSKIRISFKEWCHVTDGGIYGGNFVLDAPYSENGIWKPDTAKGGNLEELPEDVRVRELPHVAVT